MSCIDLHIHSSYSNDGEFEPEKLVDQCLARKIKYFSITDHNCVRGIHEAKMYCKNKDIEIIPGVELDCTFNSVDLHVLGYGIDYRDPVFYEIEEKIILQEKTASRERVKLVRELGIDFSEEVIDELSKNGIITGEMIAEAALQFDREQKNSLLKPYHENGPRSDNPYVNFYWDYCAQGKPAYVEVEFIKLQEAIQVIEDKGGVPVLAHPGKNIKENGALLEAIVGCGIKGLEVYSSYHSENQVQFYSKFARKNNLFLTCGSDFHGKTKPGIAIGDTSCGENEKEIITELMEIINK